MSGLPTYTFLPFARQGTGNLLTAADGDVTVALRATVTVDLELTGDGLGQTLTQTISKDVPLVGPPDVVGIEARAVVRTEPRNWITTYEPNYVPFIEFYDEDFPWRYTPAAADTTKHRLRPWIALVVLKEGEFSEGANIKDKPLPFVDVPNTAVFPDAAQLWAWAHVHVNRDITSDGIKTTAMDVVLPKFQAVLDENADLAYSRILCPRKLDANTAYHAFVMPVFESGRLAGLGLDPSTAPNATHSAWAAYGAPVPTSSYPYYYRWYFRTGTVGDFEYLVRLLRPKTVDKRVGMRDIDVLAPGANLRGITDPALAGVLKLGGALRVPRIFFTAEELVQIEKYERWATPYPHPFQRDLAALVNLADGYAVQSANDANANSALGTDVENDPDPLVTPPLYARWHALTQRLLVERDATPAAPNDNWVHELNLDPRHRVASGFGTQVIRTGQEDYMNAAWEQLGDVLEAQRRIEDARLAKQVAKAWYEKHLKPLAAANPERAFTLAAPVHALILNDGFTVRHLVTQSTLPRTIVSAPVRRVMRPRARVVRLLSAAGQVPLDTIIRRLNAGEVAAAPPKTRPTGLITVGDVAKNALPSDLPAYIVPWLRRFPHLPLIALLMFLVIAVLVLLIGGGIGAAVAGAIAAIGLGAFALLRRWQVGVERADIVNDEIATAAEVEDMPKSPNFVLSSPGSGTTPHSGGSDSIEAQRFKGAIELSRTLITASAAAGKEPARVPIDFPRIAQTVITSLDPEQTVPRRTLASIHVPERLRLLVEEKFQEPLAYPQFDTPMYKPLADLSSELLLPNIHLVEENSITLLESNQAFIEAYMTGLNHEFARELLWREYFTDQRGSPFRQFWDVSAYMDVTGIDEETLKEKLRDIPPLHLWPRASHLGDHDNRGTPGEKKEEVVLTIRGELLKKYPNAVIYAHRAKWQMKNGVIDNTVERELETLTADEEDNPPRTKLKTPLYEAKVQPDVYFFGFDLTAEQVKGGTGENPDDDPGWFFVIKERPGEPRFGLDIDKSPELNVWNDLSWEDVLPGAAPGVFIPMGATTPSLTLVNPTAPEVEEKVQQYSEDVAISWNQDMSAADVAYALYQAPVLVAVHGAEMLKDSSDSVNA